MSLMITKLRQLNYLLKNLSLDQFDERVFKDNFNNIILNYENNELMDWIINQTLNQFKKAYSYDDIEFCKRLHIINYLVNHSNSLTEASFEAVAMLIKKYLDFAENSQITISSKVNDLITQIKSKINIDYNSKMLDLKEQNANLNQQLKTYEKQINILIEENNKLKIKDTKQRHELNEKTNELKDLEKNKKIRENKIQKLIFNNNHLNKLLERNQNILDKTNANYTALENKVNKTKEIEKIIINQLYNNPTTLNNIVLELYKKNYKLTTKEIYSIIKNIKDIDIDETFYDNNLIFNIRAPKITTNAVLDFGYINNYILNVLVTADYHIGLDNFKRRQKEIDLLLCVNDYCETNDIDFIINLGDVVSIKEKNRENTFSSFSYIKEMLDFLVNNYPEVLNTQQIILGGNHDEIFVRSGIDFLEKLTNQRSDLTLVGYNHAFIKLGNSLIALHHPRNRFGCYNSVRYDLINYLKDYYKNSTINFNEVCFNLLGHTHKYNIINDYKSIFVPSLLKDRMENGAIQLKIYFNANHNIEHVEIINLTITNKELQPKYTTIYRKLTR